MSKFTEALKPGLPHLFDNIRPDNQDYASSPHISQPSGNPNTTTNQYFAIPIHNNRDSYYDLNKQNSPENLENLATEPLIYPSIIKKDVSVQDPSNLSHSGRQGTEASFGPERKPNAVVERKPEVPSLFHRFMMKARTREFVPNTLDINKNQMQLLKDTFGKRIPDQKPPLWFRLKRPVPHENPFRLVWDVLVTLFILADIILVPVEISFEILRHMMPYEYLIFAVYLTDVFVNFHTKEYRKGRWTDDHYTIAKYYLKTWFVVDAIAAFPYFTIPQLRPSSVNDRDELTWGLFRLLRLIKLTRAFSFVNQSKMLRLAQVKLYSSAFSVPFRILKIILVALVLAHWIGCIFHYIAAIEAIFYATNNWVVSMGLDEEDATYRYVESLYWAVETVVTVGYGDVTPVTKAETWYVVFAMLFGVGVFSYITSSIAAIIQEVAEEESKLNAKVYAMSKFMSKNSLSKDVIKDIEEYMEYLLEEDSNRREDQDEYLEEMPPTLRKKVLGDLNAKLLAHTEIFQANFRSTFIRLISTKLEERVLGPGEYITKEDVFDDAFYVVLRGRVQSYYYKTDQVAEVITVGGHFGSLAFFSDKGNQIGTRSHNFSRVYYLKKKIFLEILKDHEEEREVYCSIRDKVNLYDDLSMLRMRCFACQRINHLATECPYLHYHPNTERVIKLVLKERQEFRESFVRKPRRRFHCHADNKEVVQRMERIRFTYLSGDDAITKQDIKNIGDMVGELPDCLTLLKGENAHVINEVFKPQTFPSGGHFPKVEAMDVEKYLKRKKRNDAIVFDKVKIFRRYFIKNNVDVILRSIDNEKTTIRDYNSVVTGMEGETIFKRPFQI